MADRVTIVDVAALAGVAISSVSSALNDRPGVSAATRKRILAAASELGYVPSLRGRSLSAKRCFAVGLVVHHDPDVLDSDPFFASFIGGVESVLDPRGYALVLQMGTAQGAEVLHRYRRLAAGRVDGVFLSEIMIGDPRVQALEQLKLPAVGVNPDPSDFPFPFVRQDHAPSIEALVQHLVASGHTRIAHVAGAAPFIHARQRETAWRKALEAAGLETGPIAVGDFTYEGGFQAADELLTVGGELPTAVMCANDLTAIGFITRASVLGFRIPEDISVTGYDGIQLGSFVRPRLTTAKTAPRVLGREAAQLLLNVIDGAEVSDVEIPAAEVVLRESTGPKIT